MVGHTGIYNAIAKAVHAIDNCVKDVVETAKANDYEVIIIADHGNADNAINEDETPNTAQPTTTRLPLRTDASLTWLLLSSTSWVWRSRKR